MRLSLVDGVGAAPAARLEEAAEGGGRAAPGEMLGRYAFREASL